MKKLKRTTGYFGLGKDDIRGKKLNRDQAGRISTKLYDAYADTVLPSFGKLDIYHLVEESKILVVIQEKERFIDRKLVRRPERQIIAFDLIENSIFYDIKDSDEEVKFDASEVRYAFPSTIPELVKIIKLVVESYIHGILFSECERKLVQIHRSAKALMI